MSKDTRSSEWHVRRQRPDSRTTLLSFVDADANRMTNLEVLEALESSEAFRAFFCSAIVDSDVSAFVWETPFLTRAGEFECALSAAALPKKLRLEPSAYASHFAADEPVAVFESPEGTLIAPAPLQVERWYSDLGTFMRKVRAAQVHALWQRLAQTAKAAMASERVCMSSSMPGARWLHLRVGKSSKGFSFRRYGS